MPRHVAWNPILRQFVETTDPQFPTISTGQAEEVGTSAAGRAAAQPTGEAPVRTVRPPQMERKRDGGFMEFLPLLIAGLGDLAASATTGKPSTAALSTTLQLREQAEKRKEREGGQAIALLQLARAEQAERRQAGNDLFQQVKNSLATFDTLTPDAQGTMRETFIQRAKAEGPEGLDEIVRAMLSNAEIGRYIGDLKDYLPNSTDIRMLGSVYRAKGQEEALKQAERAAFPEIVNRLFTRARLLKRSKPDATMEDLEHAIKSDPAGAAPELRAVQGSLFALTEAERTGIQEHLGAFGFKTARLAEKGAEQALLGPIEDKELRDTIRREFGIDPATLKLGQSSDLAIIRKGQELLEKRQAGAAAGRARAIGEVNIEQAIEQHKKLIPIKVTETEAVEGAKARVQAIKPAALEDVAGMRKEFTKLSDDFVKVRDAYTRIETTATGTPSAAGDLSLIFSFMKLLDPTSVVREGEQASAASARGVPEAVRSVYNRLLAGEKLTENQRADFLRQGKAIFVAQIQGQTALEQEFGRLAKKRGAASEEAVVDFLGKYRGLTTEAKPKPIAAGEEIEFVRDPATGRLVPKRK